MHSNTEIDNRFTHDIVESHSLLHILRNVVYYLSLQKTYSSRISFDSSNFLLGGDGSTQQNDAEMNALNQGVYLWGSDKCKSKKFAAYKTFFKNTNRIVIYVSNEFIRFTDGKSFSFMVSDKCLFALNGQSDTGTVNQDLYLSLNRVISKYTSRYGYGVCNAKLSWVCMFP